MNEEPECRCSICGQYYPQEEMLSDTVCMNCGNSFLQKDGIDLGMGFEDS